MDWLKAILAFFGIVQKAEEMVHDHNERVAGANRVIAADNAASARVNENVAQAAVDTTDAVALERLRDGAA